MFRCFNYLKLPHDFVGEPPPQQIPPPCHIKPAGPLWRHFGHREGLGLAPNDTRLCWGWTQPPKTQLVAEGHGPTAVPRGIGLGMGVGGGDGAEMCWGSWFIMVYLYVWERWMNNAESCRNVHPLGPLLQLPSEQKKTYLQVRPGSNTICPRKSKMNSSWERTGQVLVVERNNVVLADHLT